MNHNDDNGSRKCRCCLKHIYDMAARAFLKDRSSLRCSESRWSLSALLVACHPPGLSTPFLIARCSPGCSMLPYHSTLIDTLPVARLGTLWDNWCLLGFLSLSCLWQLSQMAETLMTRLCALPWLIGVT